MHQGLCAAESPRPSLRQYLILHSKSTKSTCPGWTVPGWAARSVLGRCVGPWLCAGGDGAMPSTGSLKAPKSACGDNWPCLHLGAAAC